jgi:hypothetical protein
MQVKKLEFDLDEDLEQFRGSLLYAVNKNSSLTQGCNGEKRYLDVNREFDFTDLFSEEEDGKLNYYAESSPFSVDRIFFVGAHGSLAKGFGGSAGDRTRYGLSHSQGDG